MNKPLISALALGTALPAFAGPDWQAIEQAQKAKQATQKAGHGDAMPAKGADAMTCPPDALVLPLDHGRPRRPCAGARGVASAQGKPAAVGLAVPGMPRGSPGMDGPDLRGLRDPFDVLLVLRDGSASAYHAYR